ncbi:MAG: hypothetical protein ACYC6N_08875 [Pirellulaceae bacterium]
MNTSIPAARRATRLRSWKKLLFSILVWILFVVVLYAFLLFVRSYQAYRNLTFNQKGWTTQIHQHDPTLGYRPIPNTASSELLRMSDPVPTRFDEFGFRVPRLADMEPDSPGPRIMAFGCSFTYGAACPAELGFPFQVARQLGGRCENAGVCSYGLTQMLLRARTLIPDRRPTVVLAQYSPWLVDRAMSLYAPTYLGKQPVPYFFEGRAGSLEIQLPVFTPRLVDPRTYRAAESSRTDFTSFALRIGLPLLLHDDAWSALTTFKQLTGALPLPTGDRQAVVDTVYGEFDRLCQEVGATLVIVILDENHPGPRESLHAARHALVVDGHAALMEQLPVRDPLLYQQVYLHWRGDPPILVDHHPNPHAHAIVADRIVNALEAGRPNLSKTRGHR